MPQSSDSPVPNYSQLLDALYTGTDCFILVALKRAAPFDESDEDERLQMFFARSPHTAIGLLERAKHLILTGNVTAITDDDDEDEIPPPTPA